MDMEEGFSMSHLFSKENRTSEIPEIRGVFKKYRTFGQQKYIY
jgi:hypothetical protein